LLRPHKLILSLAFCLPALPAVSPIGTVSSEGDITVGRTLIPRQATLYNGSTIITGGDSARLSLRDGTTVQLSPDAQATVHEGALSFERGTGQIDASNPYAIKVNSITIRSVSNPTRLRVSLAGDGSVKFASLAGDFALSAGAGKPLGSLAAGKIVTFADSKDAGASPPSQFQGCLARTKKQFLLHDDASKSTIALEADSIEAKPGDRVTVVGTKDSAASPVSGADQVVRVLRLTVDGHGCSSTAAAAAAGTAAAAGGAAAAATGLGTGAMVAIGVAAAGAAVIPTVALTSGSGSSTSSSISPQSR
jgi:hypothetical protein